MNFIKISISDKLEQIINVNCIIDAFYKEMPQMQR